MYTGREKWERKNKTERKVSHRGSEPERRRETESGGVYIKDSI